MSEGEEINDSVSNNIARSKLEDVPDDLLSDIFSRVFVEHHHLIFSLVCKSWNSILKSPTPTKHQIQLSNTTECSYPHLFFTDDQLIHPISGKVSVLKFFPERSLGVRLCAGNEDWLLFAQNKYYLENKDLEKPSKVFFFNPFTQTMVWLPNLLGDNPNAVCFTSTPTSKDWKVVAVSRYYCDMKIYTIKCGDEGWTECYHKFEEERLFKFAHCNPCLYKDKYYIFGESSMLLIHDPERGTFSLHEAPECVSWSSRLDGEQYMLECDGKLLAVLVNTSGSRVRVCYWNLVKMKWETLDSLGNNVLFVSCPYSVSETASTSEMANKIYFPRLMNNRCLFYSLETKRFHTSDGSSFTSFNGSQFAFSSTWIKLSNSRKLFS